MGDALEVASILRDMGGYGVAALMWWFWRRENSERIRYRDLHESVLRSVPDMTRAVEELTDEVKTLRRETQDLKEVVAEQALELRLLK